MVDARRVAEDAEKAFLSLPLVQATGFETFYSYLVVDEPAVHLMPLHFLPTGFERSVDEGRLHELGVAAKLEYARNRWLDHMVDANEAANSVLDAHRLNDAVLALIRVRYAKVLDGPAAVPFFTVLADLHARHGLSLILDGGGRTTRRARSVALEEYMEHAMARHGPFRAPLDAVLLLVGASECQLQKARLSWHSWALGVQFYDDALDVEEDYRDGNLSWVTWRTLERLRGVADNHVIEKTLDRDAFYEAALTRGVISEALAHAESFFAESARQADPAFSSWAAFQRTCLERTRDLRRDYEAIVAEIGGV